MISEDTDFTLLYLLGSLCESDTIEMENDFQKVFNNLDAATRAIILNREMVNDVYIRNKLTRSLNRKIKDSYMGKLIIDGNYQFMLSDIYAFAEHAFGLEVRGLLNEFEQYSDYWNKRGKEKIVSYRSPLTWRSEVNVLNLKNSEKMREWYKYIYSGIIFNIWGCDCMLFADGDFDGDIIATTDNNVLVENAFGGLPITYEKKTAQKKNVNQEVLWKADLDAFNSKVGFVTNMSTTLYAMLPLYEKGTKEYEEIISRLKICRIQQGNTIDSAKGIEVSPIPIHWSQWQNPNRFNELFSPEEIEFNNKLLIDKRPYFMRYLYPKYNQEYKKHLERYDYLSVRQWGIEFSEILKMPNKNEEQQRLVSNYERFSPLLDTNCPMNNICHYMESKIKELKVNLISETPIHLIYSMMKKDVELCEEDIFEMDKIFKKYKKSKQSKNNIYLDDEENENEIEKDDVKMLDYNYISTNIQVLATLAVYVSYILYPTSSKNFAWELFGEGIILNIYDNSDKNFNVPFIDTNGDIEYLGSKYKNKGVDIII